MTWEEKMTWEEFKERISQNEDVEIVIEGGGDSGEYDVHSCEDSKLTNFLIQLAENEFEYYGFNGNFDVRIVGTWDSKTESLEFIGEEEDSDRTYNEQQHEVCMEINPELAQCIDSISVQYYVSHGDEVDLNVKINIKNGIWLEEFTEVEEGLKKIIKEIDFKDNDRCWFDEAILLTGDGVKFEITSYQNLITDKSKTIEKEEICSHLSQEHEQE